MLTKDVNIVNGMVRQKTTDEIYKGFMLYKSGKAEFTAIKEDKRYQGSRDDVERAIDKYWDIEDAKIVLGKGTNDAGKKKVYVVVNNEFNRTNYKNLIGKEFDSPPGYAQVKVIEKDIDKATPSYKNAGDRKPKHPRWRIKGDRYSTKDVKAGQTIIIEVNDPDDSLLKFLEWLKTTANKGHSFGVLCDHETLGRKAPTFGFDGDGSFRIENIIVNKDSTTKDSDNQFDIRNIGKETKSNNNFRKVLFTADRMQLVIMCLKAGEEIGEEVHPTTDQFFRIEEGRGKAVINGEEILIQDGTTIIIKAGSVHNIINDATAPLRLYSIYSPPHHQDGLIEENKSISIGDRKTKDATSSYLYLVKFLSGSLIGETWSFTSFSEAMRYARGIAAQNKVRTAIYPLHPNNNTIIKIDEKGEIIGKETIPNPKENYRQWF